MIDVDIVRQRLGLTDDPDTNDAIASSLDVALRVVENLLQTDFARAVREDIFHINNKVYAATPGGQFILKLSNGCVDPGTVTVSASSAKDGYYSEETDFVVSSDLGFVYVRNTLASMFVKVAYTSGFVNQLIDAPAWLTDLVLCEAVKHLSLRQIHEEKNSLMSAKEYLTSICAGVLQRKLRYHPLSILPLGFAK